MTSTDKRTFGSEAKNPKPKFSFMAPSPVYTDTTCLENYAVKALGEIANTLGIKTLNLRNGDPCHLGILKFDDAQNPEGTNSIICDCTFNDSTTCHITELKLKTLSLPGKLPPELVKLQYLQSM
ncbi:BnaA05g18200D [Brassica napus]|uniref:BnaA05g18200D protein n=2 Tax=Brassica TaxID=3705 RepID=A0A078GPC1_BRANA|nr:BnaA05g18200D [Brassica napus]VDC71528.1 unnamed protein product [Brassica rapa]